MCWVGPPILLQLARSPSWRPASRPQRLRRGGAGLRPGMRRTIGAMLSLTFGTEAEVGETAGRINAIHRRVHGRLDCDVGGYAAGTPYDATDPALLTWVHATLLDSQLRTYALLVGPLAPGEEDRYCAEAAQVGPLLGVSASELPHTRDRLDGYLDRMQREDRLAVGAGARRSRTPARARGGGGSPRIVAGPASRRWGCCAASIGDARVSWARGCRRRGRPRGAAVPPRRVTSAGAAEWLRQEGAPSAAPPLARRRRPFRGVTVVTPSQDV